MKAVAIQLGPIAIHWYSLMILSGILVGTLWGRYNVRRHGEDPEHVYNIALGGALLGIIGARIYYVAFSWDYYAHNPVAALYLWQGGLAIHGAIIGALIALFVYTRVYRLSFWNFADWLAPSLVLGQAFGRWGNFFNQEAYGAPARWPDWWPEWAMWGDYLPLSLEIDEMHRMPAYADIALFPLDTRFHATFLYESLWNLGVFMVLILLSRRLRMPRGGVFFAYMILYSLGRVWIEGLRTDPLLVAGQFRIAQVMSVSMMVAGLVGLIAAHAIARRNAAPAAS